MLAGVSSTKSSDGRLELGFGMGTRRSGNESGSDRIPIAAPGVTAILANSGLERGVARLRLRGSTGANLAPRLRSPPLMTIAKRLILLLAVPIVALLALAIFTRLKLHQVEDRSQFVARSRINALATIGNLSRAFADLRVEGRDFLLARDIAGRDSALVKFEASEA